MYTVDDLIYLDNAATSWPKPDTVINAVTDAMKRKGGNPGRSGHKLSLAGGEVLSRARFALARLLGASDPSRVVFCFNATDALNLAMSGALASGDHVVTSMMEHNSVTRPLEYLARRGVEYTKIATDPAQGVDPEDVKKSIRPETRMVVMTHASNVTGTINPIGEIGNICRNEGILFLVDASQSAGALPIDVQSLGVDLLAFPGHKCLLGPLGTGGLYIADDVEINPVRYGGTGLLSELPLQPDETPYKFESGTQNVHGLAGLCAGVEFIIDNTVAAIGRKESALTDLLIREIEKINGVTLYGPPRGAERAAVVSLNISGVDCADAAVILDTSFNIAVRSGLHCAPDAHRTLGTIDMGGTVRISPGFFNTEDDIMKCAESIAQIATEGA
jgi:cysteine desulfurase family protein